MSGFFLKGLVRDHLFLLLKDDLRLSSAVPLHSPLSVFWVWVVCLFILMWRIQGVTPSTFTAVGVVRQQYMDLPLWGQGVLFPVLDPHLIPGHKFVNLFPKGEQHPSLYKLSSLIYYLTQLFHLL